MTTRDVKSDAARLLNTVAQGGVGIFATDVGYAIIGNGEAAIARIFACKQRNFDKACESAAEFRDIFGPDNFFLELMDHGLDIENRIRADLIRLGQRLNLKPLATNDLHYTYESDADAHEALLCVQSGTTMADPKRFKFDARDFYLKSPEEMRKLWDTEVPGACDNTLLIAERVESYNEVFDFVDRMPKFRVPEGEDQESWLRKEVMDGLVMRYGNPIPVEVMERYETEMKVIGPMGFSGYFLIVADICKYARDNRIPVGPGRGSATGSIVAYATRITELDPLEHGLLFERFLNPERISPPDIDLDFDDRQRDQMVRYVTDTYGAAYTAQVNTFGTIKSKALDTDEKFSMTFDKPGTYEYFCSIHPKMTAKVVVK